MSDGELTFPGLGCDGCQKSLLVDESVRYVVEVRVYAAYDPMELTRDDLREDPRAKIADLIEACKRLSAEELEDQVYKEFRFHLCPSCQKEYIREPLPEGLGARKASEAAGDPDPDDRTPS